MAFTKSHRPDEVIPDSYDECELVIGPRSRKKFTMDITHIDNERRRQIRTKRNRPHGQTEMIIQSENVKAFSKRL